MSKLSLNTYFYKKVSKPKQAVLFLHGYGANGHDLLLLAPELEEALPHTIFISADAPFKFEGGILGGYQWYSLLDRSESAMLKGANEARRILKEYFYELAESIGVAPKDFMIIGFSQGSMLAMHTFYHIKDTIKGIVAFSGFLIKPETKISVKPPILLTHGTEDVVVPHRATENAVEFLAEHGVKAEYQLIPRLGHGIDYTCISHARDWLSNL